MVESSSPDFSRQEITSGLYGSFDDQTNGFGFGTNVTAQWDV
jgi:hypothetical protein